MSQQASLFDAPVSAGRSRRTDPATSRVAAKSVDLAARKQEVVDALRLLGVASTPSEILGVLQRYGSRMDIGSVRSRLNQLRRDDSRVEPIGVRVTPKPQGTGRPEQVWRLL